jgi:hypothetical protein
VDQFYFEEGYLVAGYYTIIREAELSVTATSSLSAAVIIADSTGYYIPDYIEVDYFVGGGALVDATGEWSSLFTQTAQATRIQEVQSSQSAAFTQSSLVGRQQTAVIDITSAFTPTLTVDAFKNHTAILEAAVTMTSAGAVNRSANVLLDHIADLNAMAAKTVDPISTMAATATQSTSATSTKPTSASLTSSLTLTINAGKLKTVDAQFTTISSVFVSRKYQRPLNIINESGVFITTSKFGSHSFVPDGTAARTSFNKSLGAKSNENYAIEFYFNPGSSSSYTGSVIAGQTWEIVYNGSNIRYKTFIPSGGSRQEWDNITYTVSLPINTFSHIVVVRTGLTTSLFVNGVRGATYSPGFYPDLYIEPTLGHDLRITGISSTQQNRSLFDEVSMVVGSTYGFDATSSTLTVPTAPRTNDPVNTRFLFHFNNDRLDDISLQQTGDASLVSTATISAQANPNTKQAVAGLTAVASLTTEIAITKQAAADIVSASSLSATIGTLEDIISLNAGEFAWTLQDTLFKNFDISAGALFSPSIEVQATLVGEIQLVSAVTVVCDASSFSNVPAALSSEFSLVTQPDGIARITSVSVSSSSSLQATAGYLKTASAALTNAITATITVEYFEGTSLIAPMTATMNVTAQKTARITRTLSAVASVSADVRVNPQAPAANPQYTTYQERVEVDVSYNYTYNRISGTNRRTFNFRTDTSGVIASSLFPNGSLAINNASATINFIVYEYGQDGQQDWYDTITYSFNIGVVDSVNTGAATFVNGTGRIRILLDVATENYLTVYLDGSSSSITLPEPSVSTGSRTYWPSFEPFPISNVNGRFGWPQALFPSANSVVDLNSFGDITSSSATDEAYIQYYGPQKYLVCDIVDDNFATLTSIAFTAVFLEAGLFAGTFSQSANVGRIRLGTVNIQSASTVFANAGKQVRGAAELSASATVTAAGARLRLADATITSTATLDCTGTRVRFASSDLVSNFDQTSTARVLTDTVVTLETIASTSITAERIRFGTPLLESIATQLTAAFKNATGTVLLESTASVVATVVKTTDQPNTVNSEFTVAVSAVKIVSASAVITEDNSSLTAEAERIQASGSEMSCEFAQSTNTANSLTRTTPVTLSVTVTLTASAERSRSTIALQAGTFTLTCANQVLRLAQATLISTAATTFIITKVVRITADLSALNFQLTAGDVINLDPALTYVIPQETREYPILPENRLYEIEGESRELIILKG